VGTIEHEGLSFQSVELLHHSLQNRYFLPQITKIHSIAEKFGTSQWDVETDRGASTSRQSPA
jgi:hypothetical protein